VWGGYTIAGGVVIENATGGSGDDVLLGNSSANTLTGNDGDDALLGRGGNDILRGGAGVDTITGGDGLDVATLGAGDDIFVAEVGATKVATKAGTMSIDIITDFDANGNDMIDLSGIDQAFTFKGTNKNKADGDLTYKTYASINGAENALGIEIDGNPGASGVSGPVTVVFGNVDGGNPDFMIVLLGTASVDANDFIFG
jgi:Ca2+-binding RTX toxin-like protein